MIVENLSHQVNDDGLNKDIPDMYLGAAFAVVVTVLVTVAREMYKNRSQKYGKKVRKDEKGSTTKIRNSNNL